MKNFFAIITLLLLALAGLGSSSPIEIPEFNIDPTAITESNDTLTPKCQAAVIGLFSNPDVNKCLPVSAIQGAMSNSTLLKEVFGDVLHNLPLLKPLFDAVCTLPKCSDDLVGTILKTVTTECQQDLTNKNKLVVALYTMAIAYSPGRDSICFENPKKEYCLFETVGNVAALPQSPFPLFKSAVMNSIAVASPNLICTACNKAIVNTIFNYYKSNVSFATLLATAGIDKDKFNLLNLGIDIKCGLPFNDGTVGDPTKVPPCPGLV